MNKTFIVAKETYRREVKSWSYIVMIFLPLIMEAMTIGISYFSASNAYESDYVGVVTTNKVLKQEFKNSDNFETYSSLSKAKKDYNNNDLDGYVEVREVNGQLQATYHSNDKLNNDVKSELTNKLNAIQQRLNLASAKLTTKQIQALNTQPKFVQKISKSSDDNSNDAGMSAYYVLTFILYLLVNSYTTVTAQEIATEKGTKVMEMIFSSMPGGSYFDGKILGIIDEIVTQMAIYVVGGAIFYYAAPHIDGLKEVFNEFKPIINQTLAHIVSWGLIFVVLGLILYVMCSAFCGALASKPQDANKSVQPVMYLNFIGFLAATFLQNTPNTLLAKVLSYVPFISSFLMPLRVLSGSANNIEAGISALILIVFIIGLYVLIRMIYPNLILQTDDQGFINNLKKALKSR